MATGYYVRCSTLVSDEQTERAAGAVMQHSSRRANRYSEVSRKDIRIEEMSEGRKP